MYKITFKTLIIVFVLVIYSCDFGPKPDKVVKMTIELHQNKQSDHEINAVIEILKKRISKTSKAFSVERVANSHQVAIRVETHYDPERIKNLVANQGKLEFYETYKKEEMINFLIGINTLLKKGEESKDPLFELVKGQGYKGGSILIYTLEKDTASVNQYLSLRGADSLLPAKRRYVKFLWGRKQEHDKGVPLYALKLSKQIKPALTGEVINQARQEFDQIGRPTVTIAMNDEGAKKWEDLTGKAFQERFQIAVVVNDIVYSAPGVSGGPIVGGKSEITGDFTAKEAQDFATIIESGVIPEISVVSIDVEKLQ